jgi:hypothetical protein
VEVSSSTGLESWLRLTSMGFLKAFADSCRGVIGFPVMAVGTAVLREFASNVDPAATSTVGLVWWYTVQFLVKQNLKRRALGEKMRMAQTAFELEARDATPIPDTPPGHLCPWATPQSW